MSTGYRSAPRHLCNCIAVTAWPLYRLCEAHSGHATATGQQATALQARSALKTPCCCPRRFDVSMSDIQALLLSRPGAAARHHSWWRLHLGACRRVGGCDAAAPAPSPAPSEPHARRELQVGGGPAGFRLVVTPVSRLKDR